MKHYSVWRFAKKIIPIVILILPFVFVRSRAEMQQDPHSSTNKEIPLNELLKLPGRLIADQKDNRAIGNLKLTGYRIEELRLSQPVNVELRGQKLNLDRAWRITLNGESFAVRALPAVIWIDDQIAGYGIENDTLTQIMAVTFDGDLIREGAVISLSYGEDKDSRIRIGQVLRLRRGGENQ